MMTLRQFVDGIELLHLDLYNSEWGHLDLTFDIQMDPGVKVSQAVVGVPTLIRPSVSGL